MSPLKVLTGRGVVLLIFQGWGFTTLLILRFKFAYFTTQQVQLLHCQMFLEMSFNDCWFTLNIFTHNKFHKCHGQVYFLYI